MAKELPNASVARLLWLPGATSFHPYLSIARDVIYAPVSEIGFDVLRDRFAVTPQERVSPVFDVALVDEALVLNADFTIDADQDTVSFTDAGLDGVEEKFGGINLYD